MISNRNALLSPICWPEALVKLHFVVHNRKMFLKIDEYLNLIFKNSSEINRIFFFESRKLILADQQELILFLIIFLG